MSKEAVIASFKVLLRLLLEGTEDKLENLIRIAY
jgi:hypothetical protein